MGRTANNPEPRLFANHRESTFAASGPGPRLGKERYNNNLVHSNWVEDSTRDKRQEGAATKEGVQ